LVTGAFSLRQITVCSPELITRIVALANEMGRSVQTHANEGHYEIEHAQRMHNLRPIEYLASIGGLTRGVIAAHSVLMNEREVELFAQYQVGVACCPRGNFGGLGRGQLPLMRRLGVPLGIGSDGAGGGTGSLFEAMRTLSTCLDLAYGAPYDVRSVFSPLEILKMATIGGAKVVGMEDQIGSLEPGKLADLVVLKPDLDCLPIGDPVVTVVQSCSSRHVRYVMINGQPVMMDGVLTTVNEQDLILQVTDVGVRLQGEFLEQLRKEKGVC
jgi:5-methylthioadenosine/S-adenosylhomocysteine deaminase